MGFDCVGVVFFFFLRMRKMASSARVVATRSVRVVVSDWCHCGYKRGQVTLVVRSRCNA